MNVKISMLLCLGFIIGVAWLIQRVGPETSAGTPTVRTPVMVTAAVEKPAAPTARRDALRPSEHLGRDSTVERDAEYAAGPAVSLPAAPRQFDRSEPMLPPMMTRAGAADDPPASDMAMRSTPDEPLLAMAGPERDYTRPNPARDGVAPNIFADPAQPAEMHTYKVKKGDSLAKIAKSQLGSGDQKSINALLAANPKLQKRPNNVILGEDLVIPNAGAPTLPATAVAEHKAKPAPSTPAIESAPADKHNAAKAKTHTDPTEPPPVATNAKKTTEVAAAGKSTKPVDTPKTAPRDGKKGEPNTLVAEKAAKGGSKSTGDAATTHKTDKPETVAGATPKKSEAASAKSDANRTYTVQQKDSLRTIAARELKDPNRWAEIADLNKLDKSGKIQAGQKLKLPPTVRVARK